MPLKGYLLQILLPWLNVPRVRCMVKLLVDNRVIEVEEGANLLRACLENGIYIPNLCYLESMEVPSASCRMCFVEIEGEERPVPSCTVKVREGMEVKTDTSAVRRLQRSALRLLLSVHRVECGECPANKRCELQRMARFLKMGLKPKHLEPYLKDTEIDERHPLWDYYPNRCVLCGKCIQVCQQENGQPLLSFAKRGLNTVISFFGEEDDSDVSCEDCFACVEICPVRAIILKKSLNPLRSQEGA